MSTRAFQARPPARTATSSTSGFTLIELLVVMGIITGLVSILLPSLSRAREQATIIQCESNLRVWGQTCYAFSNDHHGRFPQAWGAANSGSPPYYYFAVPNTITGDDLPDPIDLGGKTLGSWVSGGTSWDTFKRYGLTWAVANCPATLGSSTTTEDTYYSPSTGWVGSQTQGSTPQWGGSIFHLNYVYVGGLAAELNQAPSYYVSPSVWGSTIPAGKTCEDDLTDKILACDAAVDYTYWLQGYMVNHPVQGQPGEAKVINILYGDGHVAHNPVPMKAPVGSNQYNVSWYSTRGPFFYWAG